jgi:hypothetical protein
MANHKIYAFGNLRANKVSLPSSRLKKFKGKNGTNSSMVGCQMFLLFPSNPCPRLQFKRLIVNELLQLEFTLVHLQSHIHILGIDEQDRFATYVLIQ